jgi:hypothetical protein
MRGFSRDTFAIAVEPVYDIFERQILISCLSCLPQFRGGRGDARLPIFLPFACTLARLCDQVWPRTMRGTGVERWVWVIFEPELDRFRHVLAKGLCRDPQREIDTGRDAAAGYQVAVDDHPFRQPAWRQKPTTCRGSSSGLWHACPRAIRQLPGRVRRCTRSSRSEHPLHDS